MPNQAIIDGISDPMGEMEGQNKSEKCDIQIGFNWPQIGWDVILIKRFDPRRGLVCEAIRSRTVKCWIETRFVRHIQIVQRKAVFDTT